MVSTFHHLSQFVLFLGRDFQVINLIILNLCFKKYKRKSSMVSNDLHSTYYMHLPGSTGEKIAVMKNFLFKFCWSILLAFSLYHSVDFQFHKIYLIKYESVLLQIFTVIKEKKTACQVLLNVSTCSVIILLLATIVLL